jgi:predicted PurR-regulated permease PerM
MFSKNKADLWPMWVKGVIILAILWIIWLFNSAYLTPLLLGLITTVLTYPIYKFFQNKLKYKQFKLPSPICAILTIVSVSFVIFFILNRFVVEIIREAPDFISKISLFLSNLVEDPSFLKFLNDNRIAPEAVKTLVQNVNTGLKGLLSVFGREVTTQDQLLTLNKENISAALSFGSQSAKNLAGYLISTVIFVLAWLNGLVQGHRWINGIFALLPFDDKEETQIRKDLTLGVQNVVYANLLSGFVHAMVCFTLMLWFGIPNIFILTVLIFFIGVLPLSPSEIGYAIPLSLIAAQTGNYILIVILALLSEIIILWVNYVLVPKMISSQQEGNDLLILTSILSSITIFGLMGFVIGPVIMILVQTLYRILIQRLEVEHQAK